MFTCVLGEKCYQKRAFNIDVIGVHVEVANLHQIIYVITVFNTFSISYQLQLFFSDLSFFVEESCIQLHI